MGPIIICDKSCLQSLAQTELNVLRRYYSINVPPVMCIEILGDLKKAETKCRQQEVQLLADKLVPFCSMVNTPFRHMIVGEFQGHAIEMQGRAVLSGGRQVSTKDGKTGVIFEESATEKALLRWQVGDFDFVEHLLATEWRKSTLAIDLEGLQRKLRSQYKSSINLRSFKDVIEFVDNLLTSANPHILFNWFMYLMSFEINHQREIMWRLMMSDKEKIKTNFPYATFCLRAALIFHFALAFGLVSTRPTTLIDLEYLYYLPFCNAFSSKDKFHRAMANYLMRSDQTFIWGDELKVDLHQLSTWLAGLSEEEQEAESERSGPPENEQSVTHRLWKSLMKVGYRQREKPYKPLTPEQKDGLAVKLRKLMQTDEFTESTELIGKDGGDFVVRKHSVRLDAPCICGSSKTFRNCCGTYLSEGN